MWEINIDSVQRYRKAVLAVLLGITFLTVSFTATGPGDENFWHEIFEMSGIFMLVTCIIVRCWCTLYLGGHKSSEIVAIGPYSMSRNPLYLFSCLGAAGAGALFGSTLLAAAFALAIWGIFRIVIMFEERHLTKLFGAGYQQYLRTVPRYGPDFSTYRDGGAVEFSPRLLMAAIRDNALFLLIFPYAEAVEYLHETHSWPVLWLIP